MPSENFKPNYTVQHSREIEDIVEKVPSWLLRWGISVFFGIVILIFAASAFINYPNVIRIPLTIESPNFPMRLTSDVKGKLSNLLVRENENVHAGQTLALITDLKTLIKYPVKSPRSGKLFYADLLVKDQLVNRNQSLFFVDIGDSVFYGRMAIQQNKISQIKVGQKVLIKLKSYSSGNFGLMTGMIVFISQIPLSDGTYISRVDFQNMGGANKNLFKLQNGMLANATVIIDEETIMQRLKSKLFKFNK